MDDLKELIGTLRMVDKYTKAYFPDDTLHVRAATALDSQQAEIERLWCEIMTVSDTLTDHWRDWVEGGCDPAEAIDLVGETASRLRRLPTTPGDGE